MRGFKKFPKKFFKGQQKLLPDSELDRFDRYEKMNESEKELALWETIRELAEGRAISLANASKIVCIFY